MARNDLTMFIPKDGGVETTKAITAIVEQVNRLSGNMKTETDDRAVRVSDLKDGAFAEYFQPSTAPDTTTGGGTNTGKRTLKAPRSLQAFNQLVNIKLTWENVETNYMAVEVWCAVDSQVLDDAELVGLATKPVSEFLHAGISTREYHTYFVRAIGWDGAYSPWCPRQGGLIVEATNSVTINEALNQLFDDSRYQTTHNIIADSFAVLQPQAGFNVPKKVFAIGNVDGNPAVGIAGDMYVDGTIVTRMIDAEAVTADKIGAREINGDHINVQSRIQINEGGKITVGQNNLILDSATDSMIVAPDNGAEIGNPSLTGKDYCKLINGNIYFYIWAGGTHVPYMALQKSEKGTASSGVTTAIPGYWRSQPKIVAMPYGTNTYLSDYQYQNVRIEAFIESIYESPVGSGSWYFVPIMRVLSESGTKTQLFGTRNLVSIPKVYSTINDGMTEIWKVDYYYVGPTPTTLSYPVFGSCTVFVNYTVGMYSSIVSYYNVHVFQVRVLRSGLVVATRNIDSTSLSNKNQYTESFSVSGSGLISIEINANGRSIEYSSPDHIDLVHTLRIDSVVCSYASSSVVTSGTVAWFASGL